MERALILELSSDDEVGLDNSSTADNFDWITKLFDDVGGDYDDDPISNGGIFNFGDVVGGLNDKDHGGGDDDDDVVVVGENIVKKPKKGRNLATKIGDDDANDDDDCVVLDGDPDKPKDEEEKDAEDDSDDLLIVGETGQVACRDYPHPRHLCAKFPFSSTPHENRCDMCHCYVCESVAPCALWGSGVSDIDHCHATDKEECWKLERKRLRQLKNPVSPMPLAKPVTSTLPQCSHVQQISTGSNQFMRPTPAGGVSTTFGHPNIIRSQRSSIAVASNRFHPHLISQQMLRSCNGYAQVQGNRSASLAPRPVSSRPMFKRSGLANRPVVCNRSTYRPPNNVSVAFLQTPDQQLTENPIGNNSMNSTVSSLHLNLNTTFCLPTTSSVSPATLSPQLDGYNQSSPHTPTSQFHGYGHSAAVPRNFPPYSFTSMSTMTQAQNIPGHVPTNVQNNRTLFNEQQTGVTQTISGPNISCIMPDVLSSIPQRSFQTSAEQLSSLPQSCQPSSAAESSRVQVGVPMHELLPSIEQDVQQMGNTDQLNYIESWLQEDDSILGQDSSYLLDMNNQDSVPVDAGMLYFDFETSWKGLTHS